MKMYSISSTVADEILVADEGEEERDVLIDFLNFHMDDPEMDIDEAVYEYRIEIDEIELDLRLIKDSKNKAVFDLNGWSLEINKNSERVWECQHDDLMEVLSVVGTTDNFYEVIWPKIIKKIKELKNESI